ncbi:MAG TPA: metalloregulator ArsR/SmtB family transcription factor [Candidatus Polarisedimenticolaceae bacterium]|nr:metalloregulator ArsR/SmtB family transcription factor [Candidatus Polarisedimenticolaceae bacterium]
MREFLRLVKALGDESRLRALLTLREGELCLCQIIDVLGLAPATVSRHMNVLYQAGLVERRKQGKWQYYRLAAAGGGSPAALRALAWLLDELKQDPALRDDARRVRRVRRQDLVDLAACYRS